MQYGVLFGVCEDSLSHLASWLHLAQERGDVEASVEVDSRENHALTLYAHHLAWSKVGNEEHVLSDEVFWLIISSDA